MPEQQGFGRKQMVDGPSRIERRVSPRAAAPDERFAYAPPAFAAMETPTRYHGAGAFESPALYAAGDRFRALLNAYLLWFFLGWVGGHRIFLGQALSATIQAVLLLLGVALWFQYPADRLLALGLITAHGVWRMIDLTLIPDLVRANREAIEG